MERHATKRLSSVGVVMGSQSDWKVMKHTCETLSTLEITYKEMVISAHRTPRRLYNYACDAEASGLKVLIAGAGGAAHLPGMLAALTPLPVLGVPIPNHWLNGQDSLFSIVQMPAGIPVGTLAIGKAGAINAALLTGSILALGDASLNKRLQAWREKQGQEVPTCPLES